MGENYEDGLPPAGEFGTGVGLDGFLDVHVGDLGESNDEGFPSGSAFRDAVKVGISWDDWRSKIRRSMTDKH